jgi:hypothetical protein
MQVSTGRRRSQDSVLIKRQQSRTADSRISRSSWDQLHAGRPVRFGRLRPGDLLFTEGGGGHGVLVASKTLRSAPQTGERVRYVALAPLRNEFAGARRLLN